MTLGKMLPILHRSCIMLVVPVVQRSLHMRTCMGSLFVVDHITLVDFDLRTDVVQFAGKCCRMQVGR
jgi:hypothetical protein